MATVKISQNRVMGKWMFLMLAASLFFAFLKCMRIVQACREATVETS